MGGRRLMRRAAGHRTLVPSEAAPPKMIAGRIDFRFAGGTEYSGRVTGGSMEGTVKAAGGTTRFQATRSGS